MAVDALNNVLSPVGIEPQTRPRPDPGRRPADPDAAGRCPGSAGRRTAASRSARSPSTRPRSRSQGDADRPELAGQAVDTGTVDLTGATGDVTRVVNLVLPAGVTAVGSNAVSVTVHLTADQRLADVLGRDPPLRRPRRPPLQPVGRPDPGHPGRLAGRPGRDRRARRFSVTRRRRRPGPGRPRPDPDGQPAGQPDPVGLAPQIDHGHDHDRRIARAIAIRLGRTVMARLFGTDGIRGVANVDLKPTLAYALGRATAHELLGPGGVARRRPGHPPLGRDVRRARSPPGRPASGADVQLAGTLPTPGPGVHRRRAASSAPGSWSRPPTTRPRTTA